MPVSYLSPKTRIRKSAIHGRGLFASGPIRKGEIVAIKGGHILDRRTLSRVRWRIAASYMQIDDLFYIGARAPAEVALNKIFINHACEPNLGIRGQIPFVARGARSPRACRETRRSRARGPRGSGTARRAAG